MLFRRTVAAKGSVASPSCLTSSLGRSSLVSRGQQMFALRTRSPATQTQQHSGSRYHRESLPHGLRSILVDQRRTSQRRVRQIDDQKRCYILYSTSVGDKLVAFRRRVCDIISRIWFQTNTNTVLMIALRNGGQVILNSRCAFLLGTHRREWLRTIQELIRKS